MRFFVTNGDREFDVNVLRATRREHLLEMETADGTRTLRATRRKNGEMRVMDSEFVLCKRLDDGREGPVDCTGAFLQGEL